MGRIESAKKPLGLQIEEGWLLLKGEDLADWEPCPNHLDFPCRTITEDPCQTVTIQTIGLVFTTLFIIITILSNLCYIFVCVNIVVFTLSVYRTG